jgi:glyoxylase-like metal-dependent hydrolase (beta-lactamase superfamily II)
VGIGPRPSLSGLRFPIVLVAALVSAAALADAQAPDALTMAMRAMGADHLNAIQYSGSGSSFTVGQAPGPGAPWPRFELTRYVALVSFSPAVMREETVRRDVDFPPRGGGAGPFIAATGQGGMRPIPGDVNQTVVRNGHNDAGLVQISMTPHGFLKGAVANKARVTGRTIAYTVGKYTLSGTLNDQSLVESIETRLPNNVLGDVPVKTVFSGYRDYSGIKFPSRIVQTQAGHPTLDLNVGDVKPNAAAANELTLSDRPPAAPSSSPARTEPQKIADGVWFLDGGAPMSVLVEFSDHAVVIEGPQGDERTEATIAAVKQLLPSKPIRYVVNTHQHFDHSGGIRGYVAAGVPILTYEKNKPYWQQILANPFTLEPDRLARAPRSPVIETVGEKRVLSDSAMTLELHHLQGSLHDETLLVAYLPKQKLLVQADAFHPRPGAKPLASPPPFTINLVENIRRLKLDVERVVHLHGGIDSMETVVKAAGL